jgi:hypothetical protein
MRTIILACAVLALTACGAAKATRDTAQIFDNTAASQRSSKASRLASRTDPAAASPAHVRLERSELTIEELAEIADWQAFQL